MERIVHQMTQSISKAVNPLETPVKEKHVRSTIIGTFHEKGAGTFWVVALRLPLQDNRIVAWKFCHVLHKVLREGHFNCLKQSLRHRELLTNTGKLWVYLKESYGKLIHLYCILLVTKINFHERNPQFPGHLQLTGEQLDAIGENDINIYFQLSVEIFDYMDDVINLQVAILDLCDNSRPSSMTSTGQCRLSPLVPLIQDSNQLYDFSVKLLFKLHSMLPADTLSGHRERFYKQFKTLKKVYDVTRSMQYFQNLITIPSLPDNSPNFLIQSELTTYRPPVVIMPPEEQYDVNQEFIANLIDTSDTSSQVISPDTPSDSVDSTQELLLQRDSLIDNLQTEISRLRNENESSSYEWKAKMASMKDQVSLLSEELTSAKMNLEHEKEQLDLLKRQLPQQTTLDLDQKLVEAAEKEKAAEDKYQKLKTAYLQMREEHITLIRKHADTEKQVTLQKNQANEYEANVLKLESTINLLKNELSKVEEIHVQSAVAAKTEADLAKLEIEAQSQKQLIEVSELEDELNRSKSRVKTLDRDLLEQSTNHAKEKDELIEQIEKLKTDIDINTQELEKQTNELKDVTNSFEIFKAENQDELQKIMGENNSLKLELDSIILKHRIEANELINASIEYRSLIDQDKEEILSLTQEKNKLSELYNAVNNKNKQLSDEFTALIEKQTKEFDEINISLQLSNAEIERTKQELSIVNQKYLDDKLEHEKHINKLIEENLEIKQSNSCMIQDYEFEQNKLNKSIERLNMEYDDIKTQNDKLLSEKATSESKLERFLREKLIVESDLQDLLQQKESLEDSLSDLTDKCKENEEKLLKEQENVISVLWSLMRCGIQSASDIIKGTIEEFDNPAISSLQCAPDYFRSFLPATNEALSCLETSLKKFEETRRPSENIAIEIVKATHLLNSVIIQGVATSNSSKDIVFGENMAMECKNLATAVLDCVQYVQLFDVSTEYLKNGSSKMAEEHISAIRKLIDTVSEFAGRVGGQDEVGASDSVEGELANMDKTIEEAAARIEEMLRASRAADSGLKLEVNEKILDACTSLMAAVRELVKKSRALQAEIVSHGKGTNTAKEFYKRNHQWTEGLISAAKAVALGANLLLTSADKVITSGGKLEQVMVASQEIAASTAQLVVASRVRAARGSVRLEALSVASRAVSSATGAVIATAKSCAQLVEDSEELDMSGMSLQVGRRKEMDSRVKLLELEQALANERLKLAALRRTNYRLADTEIEEKS